MAGDSAGLINHEVTDDQHGQKLNVESAEFFFWREGAVPSLLRPEPQETVSQVWKSPSGSNFDLNIMSRFFDISSKTILFSLKKAGGGPFYVDIDTQENLWFRTTRDWQFEQLWSSEIPPRGHLWSNTVWANLGFGSSPDATTQKRQTGFWSIEKILPLALLVIFDPLLHCNAQTTGTYLNWFISDIYKPVFC